jgi:ComF family protein
MGKVLLQAKSMDMEAELARPFEQAQSVKLRNNVLRKPRRRIIAEACVLCDRRAESGGICASCRRILPWNDSYCECCGQALFPVDAVIKAIKFKRQLWYVPAFAELLRESVKDEFADVDSLVPVPLHRWRQMRRGFNQAAELCRPLCNATGLPIVNEAVRIRATGTQTGLNAAERKKNLKHAFAVSGKLQSRHPLIVDDVITTGETCSQLAMTLKEAGAEKVSVLTVACAARIDL